MRSIHFAVPRSLPSSFSRGIRSLRLCDIHFRRHEDMTSLVSELPDLQRLDCSYVTFGSFPAEPLRRRPQKTRNSLKQVSFEQCWPTDTDTMDFCNEMHLLALNPFLAIYDSASFFDEGEVVVIHALLLLNRLISPNLIGDYEYVPDGKNRLFRTFSPLARTVLLVR